MAEKLVIVGVGGVRKEIEIDPNVKKVYPVELNGVKYVVEDHSPKKKPAPPVPGYDNSWD